MITCDTVWTWIATQLQCNANCNTATQRFFYHTICVCKLIGYLVKFVALVLECLLCANSCHLSCEVCSSFSFPATPRGKVVGPILRQRSCCRFLKSSNVWQYCQRGRREPSKSDGFLDDKIAHFGGTSFSVAKSLKNGAVPHWHRVSNWVIFHCSFVVSSSFTYSSDVSPFLFCTWAVLADSAANTVSTRSQLVTLRVAFAWNLSPSRPFSFCSEALQCVQPLCNCSKFPSLPLEGDFRLLFLQRSLSPSERRAWNLSRCAPSKKKSYSCGVVALWFGFDWTIHRLLAGISLRCSIDRVHFTFMAYLLRSGSLKPLALCHSFNNFRSCKYSTQPWKKRDTVWLDSVRRICALPARWCACNFTNSL